MNSAIATPPLMAMFLFMMSAALKRTVRQRPGCGRASGVRR